VSKGVRARGFEGTEEPSGIQNAHLQVGRLKAKENKRERIV
jgi:hypothetical protein